MKMDVSIKKKYEAWKQRNISKGFNKMSLLSFVLLSVFVLALSSCGSEGSNEAVQNDGENSESTLDTPSDISTEDMNLIELDDSINEDMGDPVVFCGAYDPENVVILTEEQGLSYLALVNNCYRVGSDFSPGDLSVVNVEGVNPPPNGVHELRETAARALEELFQAAAADGLTLLMSSGYRSYDLQTFFHNNAIERVGVEEARRVSAIPGHSEHQLGLAADLTTHALESVNWLDESFATTPEGMWVNENAHRFGFIISYPEGREADTGIIYEPWHIRYVGVEVATEIFNAGQILEEFLWYNN